MGVFGIAWRNLGRNKRRSGLTLLALAFATTLLLFSMSLQKGSYVDMIRNTVRAQTGHMQILRKGYFPDLEMAKYLRDAESLYPIVEAIPGVQAITPRVNGGGLISKGDQTFGGLVIGIDPEREARFSTLKQTLVEGSFLEASDRDGVLIGVGLATNLHAQLGDTIVFMGQGADGSIAADKLVVRGIFKRGMSELDRGVVYAHIDTIAEDFSVYGGVSEIAILLEEDGDRESVGQALDVALADRDDLEVLPWTTLLPGVEQSIRMDWVGGLIMYALLVVVVAFGIANTFLMTYLERMREFGVLMAVGMRPGQISIMNYFESTLLTVLGVGTGLLIATPLVLYFSQHGITFDVSEEIMAQYGMDPTIYPLLNREVVTMTLSLVLGMTLLIAIWPALKILRLEPVEAMRRG